MEKGYELLLKDHVLDFYNLSKNKIITFSPKKRG